METLDFRNIDSSGQTITPVYTKVYFMDDKKKPQLDTEGEEESVDVGIKLAGAEEDEGHCRGYYNHKRGNWWVDFGGASVGHRLVDDDELEYWYFL